MTGTTTSAACCEVVSASVPTVRGYEHDGDRGLAAQLVVVGLSGVSTHLFRALVTVFLAVPIGTCIAISVAHCSHPCVEEPPSVPSQSWTDKTSTGGCTPCHGSDASTMSASPSRTSTR